MGLDVTWGPGPVPEGQDRLDPAAHEALLDRLDINHPHVMDNATALQSVIDEAAFRKAGFPEDEIGEWLKSLDSPAFRFARLDLAEQKRLTHEAAVKAALTFVSDPGAHRDADGDPDPMRAFYELGHLSHTRDLPTYALLVISADVLDLATLRDFLVFAWRTPEWPEQGMNREPWHASWRKAGFCSDTEDVGAPTGPVVVYRGASPKFKRGLAWTDDLDKARWFARRFPKSDHFAAGRVYEATATPDRVYARILGRGEDEWVVDTRRLPIRTLEVTA
jgi:hypothetical protein